MHENCSRSGIQPPLLDVPLKHTTQNGRRRFCLAREEDFIRGFRGINLHIVVSGRTLRLSQYSEAGSQCEVSTPEPLKDHGLDFRSPHTLR